ncbi:Pre-mRNA-splicing factor syf2 [Elsinoe australis]|uniref:Pre-mRNA-splicing factor SYF2 n=1 Tax=Elsinoe australis TaxID=40998 RepID=A0A2P7Z2W1_9PEZI|nr:Pre-mRNA-splicing factor syf2 [Elsinoe australis]
MADTKEASTAKEQEQGQEKVTQPSEPTSETEKPASSTLSAADERKARFAALRARNSESRKANLNETKTEHQRLTTDTSALTSINRKRDAAAHKLLKADTAAAGEDFERKRAWDWTIEESERWDKRMEKKSKHRDDSSFQDFRAEARKVYKRQLRDLKPNTEEYDREKAEMIERAAQGGGLEIVETADGELIAVDKDGSFYSTAESTDFVGNKPSKEAVDRLVGEIQKAEEVRMKKRKQRRGEGEDGDMTYINEKNKQFNMKLARFYDKYTSDIRESFERGTAI